MIICKIINGYRKSIHNVSCTYISGSLITLKRHFFSGAIFFGNFEIVFINCSFLKFSPFNVLWLTVTYRIEKNMSYTSCDCYLADRMTDSVLKYCTEHAFKKGPLGHKQGHLSAEDLLAFRVT